MELPTSTPSSSTKDAVDSGIPIWLKRVPMITGVLAGLAGFLTVRGAGMANEVNHRSILAVLDQAQASDAWAEYQADSLKAHMTETALKTTTLSDTDRSDLEKDLKKYRDRQAPAQKEATDKQALRDQELDLGNHTMQQKNLLDYAGVAAQLGIALASIAALTRKKPAFHVGVGVGILAVGLTGYALAWPYVLHFLHH
jgi:hypothetical protein